MRGDLYHMVWFELALILYSLGPTWDCYVAMDNAMEGMNALGH